MEPTTWICALTGDRTCDILVYGITLQPTESPNWGLIANIGGHLSDHSKSDNSLRRDTGGVEGWGEKTYNCS